MAAKILVVEDNASVRELVDLHLRAAGHDVRLAEDAVIAGRMLLESVPDLLVVDVGMPYINGRDFVATLVADQTIPTIPVIFLTGDATFSEQAAVLGGDFLRKPCSSDALLELVDRRLRERGQAPLHALPAACGARLAA